MKTFLEKVINKMQRRQLREMFGENCKVIVDDFSYSSNYHMPTCSVTLYVEDLENGLDFFPFGLEQAVMDSFTLLSLGKKIAITCSIKQLENGTPN